MSNHYGVCLGCGHNSSEGADGSCIYCCGIFDYGQDSTTDSEAADAEVKELP
jgi:hypothetical protein